ncbi:universal stress protein [Algibacter pacificus]|uniref:universal stress protein n=1 Tax=Algibacter pacificus TaxID=2599389 RepID=UPI0011CA9B1F|nr:universal stress protein [Algibacter pacificus]
MKKILIPTDFSENSYKAIDYILELFKNEVCVFYFLNVYNYGTHGLSAIEMLQADDEWFEKPKENSLKQLGDLLEEYTVNRNDAKHEYHVISESLSLVKALEKHTKKLNIDLIVLEGNTKVNKNIETVVGEMRTCPVLIVPRNVFFNIGINLTIASDFMDSVRTIEIDNFLKTFKNTSLKVSILVLGDQSAFTDEVNRNMMLLFNHLEYGLGVSVKVEFAEQSSNLKAYAASHFNNIMCVVDNKPGILRKFGIYKSKVISTIEKFHNHPVLTIHQ